VDRPERFSGRTWTDAEGKGITIHGFRTTFGNWSVDHGYEERDSEMALGHMVGNAIRSIYKRNATRIEPRRLMMQAWADYCDRTEPLPAEVIPLRQAK
jgi:integrase